MIHLDNLSCNRPGQHPPALFQVIEQEDYGLETLSGRFGRRRGVQLDWTK